MEIWLDLCNHDAKPSMVVRSSVHMLPREMFGKSTFELAMFMLRWLPLWFVDKILLVLAWMILGNIEKFGIKRPSVGPLELKNTRGKTPVLDIGALAKIRYDYSGYGQSSGKPSEQNIYGDIDAMFMCLEENYVTKQEDVILYGQSVGSGPTLELAAQLPRLRVVVLHSPILSGVRVMYPVKRTYWFDIYKFAGSIKNQYYNQSQYDEVRSEWNEFVYFM